MIGRDAVDGRPLLVHVCGRYLPISETFTYDLIRGLREFDACVVAQSLEHLEQFPLSDVHAPVPEEGAWDLAAQRDAAAIVCHFGPQATFGMPIALAVDRPAVTMFHGYDVSRLLRDRRWVERYRSVFALGMQALCISDAGRRALIEIGCPPEQATVIHLGVDITRFTFRPIAERWTEGRPSRLLMVARLVPKKGVHVALDAMRRLRDRGSKVTLRIIGDGPERERLEGLIAEWRLDNVVLLGALDHAATQAEFARADIYLQPSVTAESGDQEGIPVSLMEALACGVPVVSTRHAGIPELIRDGDDGLLMDEGDVDGLVAAIQRLATDPALADRLSRSGRARVETDFDQGTQTRRFSAYFRDLVSDPMRRPSVSLAARVAPTRRALLLQSIPVGLLARKLLLLSHRHPGSRFDVVADVAAAPWLERLPLVERVIVHGGTLSLRGAGRSTLHTLQRTAYDLTIVPYGNDTGDGYGRVLRMAGALGAGELRTLTLHDFERAVAPSRRRLSFAGEAESSAIDPSASSPRLEASS